MRIKPSAPASAKLLLKNKDIEPRLGNVISHSLMEETDF